jgi:hypothetical protein
MLFDDGNDVLHADSVSLAGYIVTIMLRSQRTRWGGTVRWYAATCAAKYSWEMVIATSTIQDMRLRINVHRSQSKLAILRFARLR